MMKTSVYGKVNYSITSETEVNNENSTSKNKRLNIDITNESDKNG